MAAAGSEATRMPTPAPRDPAKIWNREELYKTPKSWAWPGEFRGGATPVFIEGEPYRGKPTRLFAYYGIPEWASEARPAPAIVLIHGGLGTAYPEWVRMWVKRGFAAISVDTCGALPVRTADGKWMANPDGGPRGWGGLNQTEEPEKDQWTYHAVAAAIRSHSFLIAQKGVDRKNVGVTGVSWGGFLTCIVAAADDRLRYAAPVYGCGFNYEKWGIGSGRPQSVKWGATWDPAVYLPFAKCPFLWVTGTNDFAFSLDRVMRSAGLAKGEQAYAIRPRMVHGHGAPGEAPPEIWAFARHYANGEKDAVRYVKCAEEDGKAKVEYRLNGNRIVKAELLWTKDGADKKWTERYWNTRTVENFKADGKLEAALPEGTYAWIVNLTDRDGLVWSTEYKVRKQ